MGIAVARSGGLDNGTVEIAQFPCVAGVVEPPLAAQFYQIARVIKDQLGTAHKGEVKDDPEEQTAAHEGEARGEIGSNIEQADGKEDERGAGDKHGEPDRVVLDNQLLGGVSGDFHDCDYAAGFGVRQVGDTRWLLYFRTLQWKIPAICSLTHRAAPMDNWDEIRTAFQVARMGTVSGAAEVLGVHHATVIRHIDALEGRLGVKLFQRHARGYNATEAGDDLLRVAQATDDQFSQLVGRIKGRGSDVSGNLVVTSLVGLAPQIAPILAKFQQQNKEVSVHYLTGDRLFRLEYGEAHVAIRAGIAPEQPDNVVQHLMELQIGAYASTSYIAENGRPLGPADYAKHRFVGTESRESRAPYYIWLRDNVPESCVTFRCTDTRAAAAAIEAGAGIGFLNKSSAEQNPSLVEIHAPRPEWSAPLWLVTHVDLHRTTKVQALLQFIKDETAEGFF